MRFSSYFLGFLGVMCVFNQSVFAEFLLIKDLKSEAAEAVISYMKDDPNCHSCRGNERSAAVDDLSQYFETETQTWYLHGKVRAVSCQTVNLLGVKFEQYQGNCEVQFLLPFQKVVGVYIPDYTRIQKDINDETVVQQITPIVLTGAFAVVAQNDPFYPPIQLDLAQIFRICSPHFMGVDDDVLDLN